MPEHFTRSLLTLLAGGAVACGLMAVSCPAGPRFSRLLRLAGLSAMAVGVGTFARALVPAGGPSEGATAAFRVFYVGWAVAAGIGPAMVRVIDARRGLVPVLLAPALLLLLCIFVPTPAFWAAGDAGTLGEQLELRWAFVGLAGAATVAAGYSVVRLAGLIIRSPGRAVREQALSLLAANVLLTLLLPAVAATDLGVDVGIGTAPVVAVVAIGWLLSLLMMARAHTRAMEREIRHARADLDSQFATSVRDPLTGLFNRGYFFETVHQALEQTKRTREPFGLCLLDLDDFKAVNDTHGHPAGDLVLQTVARVLMRTCRPYDTAARYGGEEFIILLRSVDSETGMVVGERLRRAIAAQDFPVGKGGLHLTATFGMVVVTHAGEAVGDLVQRVDTALYEGKRAGKNRVRMG